MERIIEVVCGEDEDGISLEGLLRRRGISRRTVISLKNAEEGITRGGAVCRTVDRLSTGDRITLRLPREAYGGILPNPMLYAEKAYEDEDIVIYNKPPFMPVHPSAGHYNDTLANLFAAEYPNVPFRAVNRLDKDTSGLCVTAKNRLGANIPKDGISKVYYAICGGRIDKHLHIDAPIGREDGSVIRRTVREDGRSAVTDVYPVKQMKDCTLVRIILGTGRTHQIRVHMSHTGHPLSGDSLYGGDCSLIGRQALHCGEISLIKAAGGERITVTADLPEDMMKIIKDG